VKEFFKPEDFYADVTSEKNYAEVSAQNANEKLNNLIESWPVVYALENNSQWYFNQYALPIAATHKARLALIEELPKKPCKHEALVTVKIAGFKTDGPYFRNILEAAKCKYCGVELEAVWSEKK
jgi:hypothetical protein